MKTNVSAFQEELISSSLKHLDITMVNLNYHLHSLRHFTTHSMELKNSWTLQWFIFIIFCFSHIKKSAVCFAATEDLDFHTLHWFTHCLNWSFDRSQFPFFMIFIFKSSTPSKASLGHRDLIPWSAHETTRTWVCNLRDVRQHYSATMSLLFLDKELSLIVKERKVLDHMISWTAYLYDSVVYTSVSYRICWFWALFPVSQ